MDLNFKLNRTQTHFNATAILNQFNIDYAQKKRMNDFTSRKRFIELFGEVDQAREWHMQRHYQEEITVRIPCLRVVGGGPHKTTWLHVSLLPMFLLWLKPELYSSVFTAPAMVKAVGYAASGAKLA